MVWKITFTTLVTSFECYYFYYACASLRNGSYANVYLIFIQMQGFSLASAIGHSPKIVPDVREFAVQFGQFVRDDFQKCILYGNAQ